MARRKRKGRDISGVLLLDKRAGITSNKALQEIKNLYHAAKAGHTGSLDPLATGMLPICLGEATKISAFLLDADKRYRVQCRLGITTTTGDADGEIVENRECAGITMDTINTVVPQFTGTISQIPPMYSALKHQGERLYKLAREGVEVERKPRTVEIYELLAQSFQDEVLELEVDCSKGTYIRTLVEDIGESLGCGAHVRQLRRLSVGPFESGMVTIDELRAVADSAGERDLDALDSYLLPIDSGIADWPDVHLDPDAAFYMRQGQAIQVPHAPTEGWVRIYDQTRFLGVGEIQDDGRVAPRRMIQASA
ncbi:MAG: tRNA pseudouridine(55) synthase TruB [Gammaproteobacteria bacterium]|nr:tRNA pseudouridine(55) synthase TruB [Gammaproteobacteria bacterium]NNL06079.1 tRNA pseudouridine(55) synthase TruB [Gammaproteobacteria bacterium]